VACAVAGAVNRVVEMSVINRITVRMLMKWHDMAQSFRGCMPDGPVGVE
jgi:hypothetical protein